MLALDGRGPVANMGFNPVLLVPFNFPEHQVGDRGAREVFAEADAVVGQARLFAEDVDAKLLLAAARDHFLAKAVPHHAVANDD